MARLCILHCRALSSAALFHSQCWKSAPGVLSHPSCVYLPKKPISSGARFSFSGQSAPETKKLNSETKSTTVCSLQAAIIAVKMI